MFFKEKWRIFEFVGGGKFGIQKRTRFGFWVPVVSYENCDLDDLFPPYAVYDSIDSAREQIEVQKRGGKIVEVVAAEK